MARLKSKKKASSSTLLSEVNDGVEAAETVAEAEAKAPSPVTVDENSTQVTDNEENALENKVNEGVIAEADEEVKNKDQIEENPDEEVALNQENIVEEVLNEHEVGNTCDEKGEGEENEKKIDEVDVYEEGKKEESVVEQEEKKEGDAMEVKAIEEENKGKGVEEKKDVVMEEDKKEEHVMEENSEQRPKPRKRIRKRKVVKKPVSVGGIEDKQAIVEEGKVAENSKEQQSVGIPEDNSGKQNIKSRKRNRRKKPLNKPDLLGRKKLKIGENDTQIEVKDVVEGEIVKENNGRELGESSKNKGNLKNNVGTSKNGGKKVESMGMIFMCSSKTKQDCYIYKVLGLPAGKKNVVENIYKGMRLFLYDVDLKLLYGIYKASARGGYNLEPNAFNSQFPAQVRYQIVEDCLPLAEEKFRNIIKDNYYTRSKFNCQLNSEQVKNLCKLFVKTGKVSRSEKLVRGPPRSETKKAERGRKRRDEVRRPSFRDRDRNRPIAPLLRHPPTYGRPPTREVYMQEPPPRREVYREEPPHREVYRHEPPRREVFRHEPPRREVYRHEQPPREVYMHEPLREVYRHEPPPREMYRHEPPPREMYRLDHPHPPVERRESYAHPHMFNGQDVMKREPYTEQRHLEHHDPYRRETVMESYNRRVPLLEHSDSYRQLYGERKQLSLEPRRHNEMPNLEPRRQNEMPNLEMGRQNDRYNDNVYSAFQPRQMDTPSKGLLALYGPTTTTTEAPPEYYPHDPFIGRLHH